jgi:hypothetical protein
MSEPIWTNIEVRVPPTWNPSDDEVPEWLEAINDYLCDGYSGPEWNAEGSYWHLQGDANYGMAADSVGEFLDWCHKHKVPYRAWDDTKYEFVGQTHIYDGGSEVDVFTNDGNDGYIVMTSDHWSAIWSAHDGETALVAAVAAFFERDRAITALSIAHLSPNPPPIDDDDVVTDNPLADAYQAAAEQMETSTC